MEASFRNDQWLDQGKECSGMYWKECVEFMFHFCLIGLSYIEFYCTFHSILLYSNICNGFILRLARLISYDRSSDNFYSK